MNKNRGNDNKRKGTNKREQIKIRQDLIGTRCASLHEEAKKQKVKNDSLSCRWLGARAPRAHGA